jgi:hypothetical protein
MKSRIKTSTADWLAAIVIAALFLLPLWLPHAPMSVQVPIAILVTLVGLLSAASALRNRWRLSKNTGQFLRYYLRLVAVAVAIVVAFMLLMVFVIARL